MKHTSQAPSRKPSATASASGAPLSDEHRRILQEGSGISPEVVAERGVRTVRKGRGELPGVYSWRQKKRAPGILFTIHAPNGDTCTVFRPDAPDPENPGHKYEQECKHFGGAGNRLDVHPSIRYLVEDKSAPVMFVEGIKKADSITSAAREAGMPLLPAAISGVWNWMAEGEPISDMWELPVEGRRTLICFDSDMLRNPNVQQAAEELAEHLRRRGAEVLVVYLPDRPDGSKNGADDFLVGGGRLAELLTLARSYAPGDLRREKLSRDERLRRSLAFLAQREEELPAKTRRDCSKRAAWRALVGRAEERGKPVGDGVVIEGLSARRGAELSAVSQPTFSTCVADLEAEGFLKRQKRQTKEQATPYVLLVPGGVSPYQDGGEGQPREPGREERESDGEGEAHRGDKAVPPLASLPEMRWSSPSRKPRHGVAKGTRRIRQGRSLTAEVPSKRRPGKKRLEIVRYLASSGGTATREELLERFGGKATTWRDFKKQTLADLLGGRRSYRGQRLSVGPPVVELDADGVRLVEGWREALEEHRIIGQEPEAAAEQQRRHLHQSIAYRKHLRGEIPPDDAPTEEEMEARRGERAPGSGAEALAASLSALSPVASALAEYLDRNPHDVCQPAGWLGVALWAEGLHPKLEDPPAETKAALKELGGEAYVRKRLATAMRPE